MPRHDWNTPSAHSRKPHHKAMHSPARGKGHDSKLRAAKNRPDVGGYCQHPVSHRRRREAEDE